MDQSPDDTNQRAVSAPKSAKAKQRLPRRACGIGLLALSSFMFACADDADPPGADPANAVASDTFVQTAQAPVIALRAGQITATVDSPRNVSDETGAIISVSDADGPGGDGAMDGYDIFIEVSHGTLRVADGSGAVVYDNGTARIKVWATLDQLNASMATLQYVPDAGFAGDDMMQLSVFSSDRLSDADQIAIRVQAAGSAPQPQPIPVPVSPPLIPVPTAADAA